MGRAKSTHALAKTGRVEHDRKLSRFHNGFYLQGDRSTTYAEHAADCKLAWLRAAGGAGVADDRPQPSRNPFVRTPPATIIAFPEPLRSRVSCCTAGYRRRGGPIFGHSPPLALSLPSRTE
jgi:hypothetical protein